MAAIRIVANVIDLVTAGFAASNDAVNRLGVLRHAPSMPAVPFEVPPIPWPAPLQQHAARPGAARMTGRASAPRDEAHRLGTRLRILLETFREPPT